MPSNAQSRSDYLPTTIRNVGSIPSVAQGYVIPTEFGNAFQHVTVLSCIDLPVTTGNTTAISFGSKQIYDFPAGRLFVKSVLAYFSEIDWAGTDIGTGGSGDYSIGTTATADSTLSSTDVDLLPSSAMLDPFVAGIGRSNAGTALAAAAQFDGTATAIDAFLNVIVDDADVSDGASDVVLFTGTIRMNWDWLGDY